jgi:hypothetical protein
MKIDQNYFKNAWEGMTGGGTGKLSADDGPIFMKKLMSYSKDD